jgi:phosphatidylinositol glycan class U
LLNPYTIMSCLARSTTSLDNTLLTSAIALAASRTYLAMPLLAMATHTSLYPLLLLPPFLMLQHKRINSVALYTATFALVYGLNHATLGAKWMRQTLGVM